MDLAVQIPKQAPEGSRWGPLDSPEHTDFYPLAARKPLLPLAGPGDVVLPPRLIWIRKPIPDNINDTLMFADRSLAWVF